MTKEEREKAVDLLDNLIGMIADNQDNDYDKALKMGIESLRKEPCEDAVSRKAVLNLVKYLDFKGVEGLEHYKHKCIEIEDVEDLPSVTPELSSLREMNDALKKRVEFLENMIRYASAPARKRGKWICVHHIENKITYDSWKCSECQHDFESEEESMVNFDEYKHCPNCGAEMESENDSN